MEPGDEFNPWTGFAVRFTFGAVFGALLELGWFAYSGGNDLPLVFWMVVPAVLCGVLAAKFGDDFWQNITWW